MLTEARCVGSLSSGFHLCAATALATNGEPALAAPSAPPFAASHVPAIAATPVPAAPAAPTPTPVRRKPKPSQAAVTCDAPGPNFPMTRRAANIARAATATTKENGKVIGMQKVKGDKGKGRAEDEDADEDEEDEEYVIN